MMIGGTLASISRWAPLFIMDRRLTYMPHRLKFIMGHHPLFIMIVDTANGMIRDTGAAVGIGAITNTTTIKP
ncbi:hypothetical protein TPL01_28360 [Sulfuriferula plumbiphila]|uniref:Uncharacterized protein n=1 Tax=Sulfuriferula plumbiphila TaxID=171865 RepID=A0A512LB44_9PROT|nr:hypothetical protein SFPGR_17360 [Sulfuriferula plumbiphila]GEP31698.1 hypothetical protein TPL01_28360 [Sulfuriferula plumbiphila]